jgi:uncharacterized membrane protein YkvI
MTTSFSYSWGSPLPISNYGMIFLSTILFGFCVSVLFFHEMITKIYPVILLVIFLVLWILLYFLGVFS